MKYELKQYGKLQYVLRYPNGYDVTKKYPVIIFLHGAGTRGTDIAPLVGNSFFKVTEKYIDFPFISVAPLCHENMWFDLFESLKEFTKAIANETYTNPSQLYLMGNSMGGYTTWALAMSMPEYFAAIIPICGGGMYWNAERLINIPIQVFHGDADTIVNLEESRKMVDAIKQRGGNVKLTIYPGCGHDSWTRTYEKPEVFEWLLSCKK